MKISILTKSMLAALALAAGLGTQPAGAADESTIVVNRNWSSYDRPLSRTYTGRSPFNNDFRKAAPPAAVPVATTGATTPAPAPTTLPAPGTASASLKNDGVTVVKKAPSVVNLGEEFTYEIVATADSDVADVVVTDILPEGVDYVGSDPSAAAAGRKLSWTILRLNKGESKTAKVRVKASREGELVNCITVSATPVACVTTVAGKAQLAIDKSGPETAQIGQDIPYTIVVKNTGNVAARNVVVTDTIPNGLSHASGQKTLSYNVGDLAPGASRTINVSLKGTEAGRFCNVAEANSANAGKVSDDACTRIVKPGVKITKVTDNKELFINRDATYTINVKNTGDVPLTGVVVTDNAAAGTTITSVDGGGTITGNTATWRVGDLAVGAEKTYKVVIKSTVAGEYCNNASVATAQNVSDSAKACTTWKGVTGILVEMVDDPDPIMVGETTTYTIRITNQGSMEITDINAAYTSDEETTVTSASVGQIVNGNVTFPKHEKLAPKASITYTLKVKGVKAGDSRNSLKVTASNLKSPVEETESTTVY